MCKKKYNQVNVNIEELWPLDQNLLSYLSLDIQKAITLQQQSYLSFTYLNTSRIQHVIYSSLRTVTLNVYTDLIENCFQNIYFTCTLKSYVGQVASKLGYSRGSKWASTYFWPISTNFKGHNSANNKLTHVKFASCTSTAPVLHVCKISCESD